MNDEELLKNRTALLQKLTSIGSTSNPTKEAKEALRILNSLQQYTPQETGNSASVRNPVTGIGAARTTKNDIIFENLKSGFNRPDTPNSRVKLLGIRASINQLLDTIPTAKNHNKKIFNSSYTFTPLSDSKEGSISGFGNAGAKTNQRNNAYMRYTKGAFQAHPNKEGDLKGFGERIDRTTWQPRGEKRRFGKHVQFDPLEPVKRLGDYAGRRTVQKAVGMIPQVGKLLEGLMIASDMTKSATGKGFDDYFREGLKVNRESGEFTTP